MATTIVVPGHLTRYGVSAEGYALLKTLGWVSDNGYAVTWKHWHDKAIASRRGRD